MKKITLLIITVFMSLGIFAQAPDVMSYQAVIRDASDILLTDATVGMQISILEGSTTGTPVYVETQTPLTNTNGLVSLQIGTGTVVSGDISTIDWSASSYFIKTETDPTGGTSYSIEGTGQLLSVPYALYAKSAGGGGVGNTLDEAYDEQGATGTRTINADDGKIEIVAVGNTALEVTSSAANDGLVINNTGTSEGQVINSSSTGNALEIDNDGGGDGVVLTNDGGGDAVDITNDGGGKALDITNDGGEAAIVINNDGDGESIFIDNAGAGDALFIDNLDSTGSFAISINNDGGNSAIDLLNDGGGNGIDLTNNGGGIGLRINELGAGDAVVVDNDGGGIATTIDNLDNTLAKDALVVLNDGGGRGVNLDNAGAGIGLAVDNLDGTGIAVTIDNDGGGHALNIGNTGGGRSVDIGHSGTGIAVEVANSGDSKGLRVSNTNMASAAEAAHFIQSANGDAVLIENSGTAIGTRILNTNPAGDNALFVGQAASATGVMVDNMGDQTGVHIVNGNPTGLGEGLLVEQAGEATTVVANTIGTGSVAELTTMNPANDSPTFIATNIGTNITAHIITDDNNSNMAPTTISENRAIGSAGLFVTVDEAIGKLNSAPTVQILSDGKGSGLNVIIDNPLILPGESNTEPAIIAEHRGFGSVARFENADNLNDEIAVDIINHGLGVGLHVDSFGNTSGLSVSEAMYVEISNASSSPTKGRTAVFDLHEATSLADSGVLIRSAATWGGHAALRVIAHSPTTGKAAVFSGDVDITSDLVVGGSFSAAAKAFKIDHPLDPENKYLVHNSIESNERINIYAGNCTTNTEGLVTIQLPEYMNALNKDFKYQLTIVDKSFAQAIIWEPMNTETNTFVIKTNEPNIQVSWQITGTRQDTWALENPMKVEVAKETSF